MGCKNSEFTKLHRFQPPEVGAAEDKLTDKLKLFIILKRF